MLSITVEAAGVAGAQHGDSLDLLASRMGALGVGDVTEFALRSAAERDALLERAVVGIPARVRRLLLAALLADEEAAAPSMEALVGGMGASVLSALQSRRRAEYSDDDELEEAMAS